MYTTSCRDCNLIDIAGLKLAAIPYTPIPAVVTLVVRLLVDPPLIANVLVLNVLGPGTSDVKVNTLVLAVAVKSDKAALEFM